MGVKRIGFVGLGRMGAPMADRLEAAGHRVTRYRRGEPLAALAQASDLVITMVGGPADVAEVYRGGLLTGAATHPGSPVLIDMTTSSPALARELATEAGSIRMLDAPVTGGVGGAKAGTLSMLVGGDADTLARVRPELEALGTVTHCGPTGSGQRVKLVNQTIVAGIVTGLAEGIALARAGGIEATTLRAALGRGTAGGMLFEAYVDKMYADDYAANFSIAHFVKDLRLARAEARALGLDPENIAATLARCERVIERLGPNVGIQAIAQSLPD